MKIRDIMTESVESIDASSTIAHAARRMAEVGVGVLPVLSSGELVGVVTDRDIAVRGVATGMGPNSPVRRVMTQNVATCWSDDDVESVLALMSREQIRRMPVCDQGGKVIGIVGLSDAAQVESVKYDVADTLVDICKPNSMPSRVPLFA